MFKLVLYISIIFIALPGIVYELIIATSASYLLGNSIYHFSMTIGLYMSAMGIGAWISKKAVEDLLNKFVILEIFISIIGGFSALLMYATYAYGFSKVVFFGITIIIGILVGIELPILMRIMKEECDFKSSVADSLSLDYFGALIGSISFPLILLPNLGIIRSAFLIGMINLMVVAVNMTYFRPRLKSFKAIMVSVLLSFAFILGGFVYADKGEAFFKQKIFRDQIIFNKRTTYQEVTITRWRNDIRMFIEGNLQFCSIDEYRYHEVLVHPAMSVLNDRSNILILGGGDGLAARELLKYSDVKSIDIVDIDKDIISFCRENPLIRELNGGSLDNPKVHVIVADAYNYVSSSERMKIYNLIISDLPDPNNIELNKLYTEEFYSLLKRYLAYDGYFVCQSNSPYFSPKSFWCIGKTLSNSGLSEVPMKVNVPSFGEWGFFISSKNGREFKADSVKIKVPTKFLDDQFVPRLFAFDKETLYYKDKVSGNSLNHPVILRYYNEGWTDY